MKIFLPEETKGGIVVKFPDPARLIPMSLSCRPTLLARSRNLLD